MKKNTKSKETILSKIVIDDVTGCWNYIGSTEHNAGYAQSTIEGKKQWLHRAAWEIYNGPIIEDENHTGKVIHICENRKCLNPEHLELEPRYHTITKEILSSIVDIDVKTGCWNAKKTLHRNKCYITLNGKLYIIHKLAWELYYGEIPDKMYVMHECGNKKCCNPDHLELDHRANRGKIHKRFKTKEYIQSIINVDTVTGCWNCKYESLRSGYCVTEIGDQYYLVHRLSWEIHNGPIITAPDDTSYHGTCVLHKCHNRKCCNPEHLKLGSHRDNMDDMTNANRQFRPQGEASALAKLTNEDIYKIRALYDGRKHTIKQIADTFNVCENTIYRIVYGKAWAHI